MAKKAEKIAVVGMEVMGKNLARNIAGHGRNPKKEGFPVVAFNRTTSKTEDFLKEVANEPEGQNITGATTIEELVQKVGPTGAYWLMVKALGPDETDAVDLFIDQLLPLLKPGAIIIDGGNSYFKKTIRRAEELDAKRIMYIGTGVSGGEEGALKGPAIMPGGQKAAYKRIQKILEAVAAKAPQDGAPCVSHIGPGGAGHYVKMIHNGIEYGDMGMIGEAVWIMHALLGWDFPTIGKEMAKWNRPGNVLQSYLIEITADGLQQQTASGAALAGITADITRMKGTGLWTCMSANELLVPTPTIYAAVQSRMMSEQKELRLRMAKKIIKPKLSQKATKGLVRDIHDALYTAKISSYAQGIALMQVASDAYDFGLDVGEIARGWRGGCIIRAQFLDDIFRAYRTKKQPENLIAAPFFTKAVNTGLRKLANVTALAHQVGIATPVMDASCNYLMQTASGVLLGASVNAQQRDYFGAHGYFKIRPTGALLKNRKGEVREFHTGWMLDGRPEKEIT